MRALSVISLEGIDFGVDFFSGATENLNLRKRTREEIDELSLPSRQTAVKNDLIFKINVDLLFGCLYKNKQYLISRV